MESAIELIAVPIQDVPQPAEERAFFAAAARHADSIIVSDDNPRSEDPAAIRREVLQGAPNAREVGDRAEAIGLGIAALGPDDALVIAGKGHEETQIIGSVATPFSDRTEAVKAALALGGTALS